ncbi:hypothetical protein JYQ62_15100 [Nostoc sp. UHCC 0702]|nr:hypothetical protein JYQ62_15100 [Nostoc sp. UHCC 0702]
MATIIGINQPETLIGTIYNDNIKGKGGNDTLIGDSGNDTLDGGTGNDTLKGGSGNDTYIVDSTGDIVSEDNGSGGDSGGIDTVKSSVDWTLGDYLENLTLTGTAAINGSGNALNNSITGNASSNTVYGGDGDDSIRGFAGDDTIYGEAGNDKLYGGDGDDYLQDSLGNNSLYGGAGNDYLTASSSGNNVLDGGNGSDYLRASGSGNNVLDGGNGNDLLLYSFDSLEYYIGSNTFNGGDGNDNLLFSSMYIDSNSLTIQTVDGGKGNDYLYADYSSAQEGILTTLDTTNTNGTITAGNFQMFFQDIERFRIYGTVNSDSLLGGNGNDDLDGGFAGNDTIKGGAGDDTIYVYYTGYSLLDGGDGNDILTGGYGVDTFAYSNYTEGVDTINNFDSSQDLIQVSANGFGGGLTAGSLSESQFVIGTAATTNAQRFIYDNTTGALYFDLDGSGSGFTQQQLAQLTGGVTLSASNFTIV